MDEYVSMLYDGIFSSLLNKKKMRSPQKSMHTKKSIYRVCHGNGRYWCPEPYNLKSCVFFRKKRVSFSSHVHVILYDKDS
ncbi:unnamed protein product [Phytomonas sp. Hart1]|nr:unnamed protein product [Phytomonas sp. Hart1]|eukprot:CCW66289.1 unnamed protein product [Phytomonas sp. isolate Hart1]